MFLYDWTLVFFINFFTVNYYLIEKLFILINLSKWLKKYWRNQKEFKKFVVSII